MKRTSLSTMVFTILSTMALIAVAEALQAGEPASNDTPKGVTLERFKQLEGDWVQLDENGKPSENIVSSFKVTAGGSAVREILFGGSDHEMLSVYYQKGEKLLLTHYCVLGNQPLMEAKAGKDPGSIVFVCTGTNLASKDEPHMHKGTITFIDKNHIKSEWQMFEKGKQAHATTFDLVRKK